MNGRPLPHVLLMALVAVAVARPASALPPSTPAAVEPVRVELVDDATLGAITGKYFGADMLVGVRIDILSSVATQQGGQAVASGTLHVQRNGSGFDVQLHTTSSASTVDGVAPAAATGAVASGATDVQVQGIGQVTQIAGDGNRLANLAVVRIGDALDPAAGFNGQASSQAQAGDAVARISFVDGRLALGVQATGIALTQASTPGAGFMQTGQIAGNGLTGTNMLQMQLVTAAMPTLSLQQLGIQQALSAVTGLRR